MNFREYLNEEYLNEAAKLTRKLNKLAQNTLDAFDKTEDLLIDWKFSDEANDASYPHKNMKKYAKSLKDARMYFQLMEENTRK